MTLFARKREGPVTSRASPFTVREGGVQMSLMCSIAACRAKAGMCTHEKVTAGVIALLVIGFVAAKSLSLF